MTRELIEATATTHGPVTFTSREIGRLADTDDHILNTALYYALGLARSQYAEDLNGSPSYESDTAEIADQVYVTPAAPVAPADHNHTHVGTITTIRNARTDEYVEPTPNVSSNVPSFEQQRSLTQENHFRFYIIPRLAMTTTDPDAIDNDCITELLDTLPRYFRLGAGRGKVRTRYRRLRANLKNGVYSLGHPISYHDVPERPTGNAIIEDMQPVPLVVQGEYDGPHLTVPATPGPPVAGIAESEVQLSRGAIPGSASTDDEQRIDADWQAQAMPDGPDIPGPDSTDSDGYSIMRFEYPATAEFLGEKR